MNKLITICVAILMTTTVFAQSPEKMSYQAVIRNSSNVLVTNQSVGMQISILQGSAGGTAVYVETQTPTTNANGLVSIEIGSGSVVSGDFATIYWANGPYFIKTETDPAGGTSYSITGTSQLLSVPYALHAKTAETVTGGITETDPVYTKSQAANITATDITNLSNLLGVNTGDQDLSTLATKTALGDSTAQVRSEIPDVSGFLTSETDPVYSAWDKSTGISITESQISNLQSYLTTEVDGSVTNELQALSISNDTIYLSNGGFVKLPAAAAETDPVYTSSQAANIDAADITNLGNLSGINTGDQDISGIAINTQAIQDTASQIRADIPTIITYSVGDFAQGGIVFWVDETGQHGLVCAKEDQSTGLRWYAGTFGYTQAKGDGPYAGEANTSIIIAAQVAIGDDGNTYAARICNELQITEGGKTYGDWYLPSKMELDLMYQNRVTINATAVANGGSSFLGYLYWSSTEESNIRAWYHHFGLNIQNYINKNYTARVRAVRAF